MSALNAPRNTREIFCGGTGYSRKLDIAEGCTLYPGAIAAVNSSGKAVPASDTAGLFVAGICDAVFNGSAYIRSGTYRLENNTGNDALTIEDIGKYVYIVDDQTVGKNGGTNAVVAGILMDLDDGQAIVSIGNHPVYVPVAAMIKHVSSEPAAADKGIPGTILLLTGSWENGTVIPNGTAGEVYINNGTNWVKIG